MLKIGIIGSGFGLYGLLPAFKSLNNCSVVSICSSKTKRLLDYCEEINLKNIYTDWKLMLDKEKLDAIAIAVTPNAQYEIAKVAIKKNLHVFLEKPLSANINQAEELLKLAQKNKVITVVDFIFPEINEWIEVKKMLDKKTFGTVNNISVNWEFLSYTLKNKLSSWKMDINEGGGALSFYFSHVLYYLEYFIGEILDLKSLFTYSNESKNNGDVGVDFLIKFKNNINGNAHLNCNVMGINKHQLIFECSKGTIILQNENNSLVDFSIRAFDLNSEKKIDFFKQCVNSKNEDERVVIVRKLAQKFINACINNHEVTPSIKNGFRVQFLIDKIRANKF